MSNNLLAKEKEYRRMNKELEEKTNELIKEVNSVINTHIDNVQSRLAGEMYSVKSNITMRNSLRASPEPALMSNESQDIKSDVKERQNPYQQNVSDPIKPLRQIVKTQNNHDKVKSIDGDNTGTKAIINFLNAKIDILHKELQTIQIEYKKKVDHCKEIQAENKKLSDDKTKLCNQIEALKETINKMETTNNDLQSQCQASNAENAALKKDIDDFKKQIKSFSQQISNYELRLNRSVETNDKLRNALKYNHAEEKELRDQIRKLTEDKRIAVKNLEKQRSELIQAFKKQTMLIDNLKKQNAYLIANNHIQLTEEDFSKLLDWKPQ